MKYRLIRNSPVVHEGGHTDGSEMLEPWKNPRSKDYWSGDASRNGISDYFAGRAKIKDLRSVRPTTTAALLRARRRTSGSNASWRRHLVGRPPTSCRRSSFGVGRRGIRRGRRRTARRSRTVCRSNVSGRYDSCRRRSAATGIWCRSACTYATGSARKQRPSSKVADLFASCGRHLRVFIGNWSTETMFGLLENLGLVIGRAKFNVFAVRAEELIERRPS